jgi:hypothetical protein
MITEVLDAEELLVLGRASRTLETTSPGTYRRGMATSDAQNKRAPRNFLPTLVGLGVALVGIVIAVIPFFSVGMSRADFRAFKIVYLLAILVIWIAVEGSRSRIRKLPVAPSSPALPKLLGQWRLVRSSDDVPRTMEMDIRPDGRLFCAVPLGKGNTNIEMYYEIDGPDLVLEQPDGEQKMRTHFSFEPDGSLVIQSEDGARTWYHRVSPSPAH